jgi:hypothetical protein
MLIETIVPPRSGYKKGIRCIHREFGLLFGLFTAVHARRNEQASLKGSQAVNGCLTTYPLLGSRGAILFSHGS